MLDQLLFLKGKNSPLIKEDENSNVAREKYFNWRKVVMENMNSALDYRRLAQEADELRTRDGEAEKFLSTKARELDEATGTRGELQSQVSEARTLLENSRSWQAAASRIKSKMEDADMKEMDLSGTNTVGTDMRDLKTVEKDIAEKLERKDRLSNEVSNIFI